MGISSTSAAAAVAVCDVLPRLGVWAGMHACVAILSCGGVGGSAHRCPVGVGALGGRGSRS